MERRGLFRGMLVVGILAILGLIIVFATEKKESKPITSWQTYTSQTYGYSISYPAGWIVREIDSAADQEVRFSGPPNTRISVISSLVGTLVTDILKTGPAAKTSQPLKEFHEMLVRGMTQDNDRLLATETTEMKVAGADAYGTTFKYHTWTPLAGRAMESMLVSTSSGDGYVALTYACPLIRHDIMFSVFGNFMGSFKPKKT